MLKVSDLALCIISKLTNSKCREGPIPSSGMDEAQEMWLTYILKRIFTDVFDAILYKKSNILQRQLGIFLHDDGSITL